MNDEKDFDISWDIITWTVTILSILLFAAITVLFLFADQWFGPAHQLQLAQKVLIPLIAVIIAGSALFAPLGYRVTPREVIVRRIGPNTRIPIDTLADVRPIALERAWRLFGNGGLFGFMGLFRAKGIGTFRAAFADRHKAVLLERDEKSSWVLSPKVPEEFVAYVDQQRAH